MTPLLTFYGDDFTGSSAVMEVLAFAGVPTVMFLDAPSPALLAKLDGIRAIGIAGVARSKDPDWMTHKLPRLFTALKALGAPLLHYKTCSTFDSAPHLGSIGRAAEIGLDVTGADWAALVVGAPVIGRYQVFGHLFAVLDGVSHRLDRHPVMARHPATPMAESDLCRHLDRQTDLPKAIVDFRALLADDGKAAIAAARRNGARLIALDAFDDATLAAAGRILWDNAGTGASFALGSQGVEYALVAHWRQAGLIPARAAPPALLATSPLLVVSGSCAQTTAAQIAVAEAAGFLVVPVDACQALSERGWNGELERVEALVLAALSTGRNVLACTARGPGDQAITRFNGALAASATEAPAVHERIGAGLGRLVRAARRELGLKRAVFSGGDTSGHAMLAVGAEALEPVAALTSGAPMLRIRSSDANFDGMEVALKGGQMGDTAVFVRAAQGSA
jgi:3-oxoisoapionate kinase